MFAVETETTDVMDTFIERTRARLGIGFTGTVWVRRRPLNMWTVVILEPQFPPVWRYLSVFLVALFIVLGGGLSPLALWGLTPMVVEVFLSPSVQCALFKRGLRKAGYKGRVRILHKQELLRGILNG